jgi:hypothetical protein
MTMLNTPINVNAVDQARQIDNLRTLSFIAGAANKLSHRLNGTPRELALAMKDLACSLAIIEGAVVDGQRTGDLIGLTFLTDSSRRGVHARLSRLHPEARGIARRRAASAPAVSPLGASRGADQLQLLRKLLPARRAAA